MASYELIKAALAKSERNELNSGLNSVLFQNICITALEALEKHIPMPVEKSNYKYKAVDVEINEIRHYDASRCPVCDKWLTKIYKYCPHCGQRIVENN